jgi:hypothetical protein
MDSILVGVSAAIQVGLEVLPEAMAQLARDAIAVGLREVQAQGMSAMPAISEHVEDGEFEDAARTS